MLSRNPSDNTNTNVTDPVAPLPSSVIPDKDVVTTEHPAAQSDAEEMATPPPTDDFSQQRILNTVTPSAKSLIEGNRMYPSPCNPPVDVHHAGRQASSAYDYNRSCPSPDGNTMNFAIVRNFPPDPNYMHS